MITYLDKILYLHPEAQGVMYWDTHHNCCFNEDGSPKNCDMQPWDDPYEGLVLDNPNFSVPKRKVLDALDENVVLEELYRRKSVEEKRTRDIAAASDLSLVSAFEAAKSTDLDLTFSEHMDKLEIMSKEIIAELVEAK